MYEIEAVEPPVTRFPPEADCGEHLGLLRIQGTLRALARVRVMVPG